MAAVTLENVGKVYPGGVQAVADFDLTVEDGEFLVLVGPSGCGKTTTLRMLAGLERITAGTLRFGDRVLNHVPPKDRDVAMVFQNYALYPHMTVYRNMAFALQLRKTPKAEIARRVTWAAKTLGLASLLHRKPAALSGGQRQRVAVARAIVRQPQVFLFDEPLSNLDAKLRAETRAELKRLHRKLATTTIYVTHDQEEAMTLGDRIVVMRDGRIQQCDSPLDVYHQPANRFVAGFVGTPAMNFVAGALQEDEHGSVWFDAAALRFELAADQAASLRPYVAAQVTLGIRPDGLQLQPLPGLSAERQQKVAAKVEVVEPLGSLMDLHVVAAGQRLVCRLAAEPLAPDTPVTLYIDAAKTHFFATDSDASTLGRRAGANLERP